MAILPKIRDGQEKRPVVGTTEERLSGRSRWPKTAYVARETATVEANIMTENKRGEDRDLLYWLQYLVYVDRHENFHLVAALTECSLEDLVEHRRQAP